MAKKISYKRINKGKYKYELTKTYSIAVNLKESATVVGYILLNGGLLKIYPTYQWDGCSGPTWDDKTNMRAGLVHDVLYQLMCEKKLNKKYRKYADDLFYKILRQDGMPIWRAKYYWLGVRMAGWYFV